MDIVGGHTIMSVKLRSRRGRTVKFVVVGGSRLPGVVLRPSLGAGSLGSARKGLVLCGIGAVGYSGKS